VDECKPLVRGLFVPHTRTGNPLVDSVAEHQATKGDVYWKYFHFTVFTAPAGMIMCLTRRTDARIFVAAYFLVAGYFSAKMVRLVLLLGPAGGLLRTSTQTTQTTIHRPTESALLYEHSP